MRATIDPPVERDGEGPDDGRAPIGPARLAAIGVGVVVAALLALFIWGVSAGGDEDRAFGPSPLEASSPPPSTAPRSTARGTRSTATGAAGWS